MQHGEVKLAQVCGIIASDEKRHETAYTKIAKKLFELDPNEMVIAFANMMKRKISMPAHLMYDGLMAMTIIFLITLLSLHQGYWGLHG